MMEEKFMKSVIVKVRRNYIRRTKMETFYKQLQHFICYVHIKYLS